MNDDRRSERYLVVAIAVAYLAAGAVLGFSCAVLASTAHHIETANLCRRI
jgi:hypothetical protein